MGKVTRCGKPPTKVGGMPAMLEKVGVGSPATEVAGMATPCVKSAVVIANPKKREAEKLLEEVKKFLTKKGVEVTEQDADIFIAIGGDGTILYNKGHFDKPIFGIGSKSSFLCQANEQDWREKLSVILGGFRIQERLMLSSELEGKRLPDALNEVCVRNKEHRILVMKLGVDGKEYSFRADGVLFSTPTGSTAYSYSCGGSEMEVKERRYQIVAIAPYRREFAPAIVPESAECSLVVQSECDADVVIDGQYVVPLAEEANVKVFASEKGAKFVVV